MYIHLQSTRVFPSDATSDSFPTSPLPLYFKTLFWPQRSAWGFGVFCVTVLDFSRQSLAWREEVGSPGAKAVQAGWLGRGMLTLRGDLAPVFSSICDSGTDCVTLPRSGPISR